MAWTADEAQQIGRMEAKIDALLLHDERITRLETFMNRLKGVGIMIALAAGVAGGVWVAP